MLRSGFAPLVILALLVPTSSRAEEEPQSEAKHPLRPGVWALEFEVQPRLLFYPSVGSATLSARKHLSERSALRLGVLVGSSETDRDGEGRRTDFSLGAITYEIDGYVDSHDYSVFLFFTRFLHLTERVGLFIETGPTARISRDFWRDNLYFPNGDYSIYETDTDTWAAGLEGAVGFEWFFVKHLGLGARHGAAAIYEEGDFSRDFSDFRSGTRYISVESGKTRSFRLLTTSVLVTLTAYF